MGEEKATSSTLATAAEELNDYFKFWNMLALVNCHLLLPLQQLVHVYNFIIIM
ncbi:hypothetical protein RhiirA4_401143 [Rhizophagus irregularis]|uniref:Uncharacterized protein n=1 Tax=Rhizophagus irregularis TaxID=588596 RepID=A0A2I1GFH6_9GLOM|nr:hypothetical protein RhiirA4_401143 [Rhizophagus irregularis]